MNIYIYVCLCWDGERSSLIFFNVTMQSSLLICGTVQSWLFQGNNAEFIIALSTATPVTVEKQSHQGRTHGHS